MKTSHRILCLAAMAAFASSAMADIAYSNFTGSYGYDSANGYYVDGSVGFNQSIQNSFTSGASGVLDTITVAMGHFGFDNDALVSLRADSGGNVGAILGTWDLGPVAEYSAGGQVVTVTNLNNSIVLSASTQYWVECISATPSDQDVWMYTDGDPSGAMSFSQDGDATFNYFNGITNAYEVTVKPVPEPASMSVLGFGALALLRRRKK